MGDVGGVDHLRSGGLESKGGLGILEHGDFAHKVIDVQGEAMSGLLHVVDDGGGAPPRGGVGPQAYTYICRFI